MACKIVSPKIKKNAIIARPLRSLQGHYAIFSHDEFTQELGPPTYSAFQQFATFGPLAIKLLNLPVDIDPTRRHQVQVDSGFVYP